MKTTKNKYLQQFPQGREKINSVEELKHKIIEQYKKSLNPKSKFYNEDLQSFELVLKKEKNKSKLKQQYHNMVCLNGGNKGFTKNVKNIQKELERGGMYNIDNMGVKNALD